MSYDVIDRLVRPANPVPDPRMLEPVDVSVLHEQRREEMQTREPIQVDSPEESGRRGWIVAVAAGIAVIVGALVLFQLTDDSEVGDATPIETATSYVNAYAAFDVEGVESMLAEDAEVLPWEAYAPRDWQADLRYLEAAGFDLTTGECRELPAIAEGVRVNCAYEAHGLGSDQIGEGPFGGHTFRLVIADGLVVSSDMGFNFSEFYRAMWLPFQSYIQESHPQDFAVLYANESLSSQTDEAIALWEQRVADYVEYVNNPTPTTTPVEGAVPSELTGIWRGEHFSGEVVSVSLRGTQMSMSIFGPGGLDFVLEIEVDGDTILIPATPDIGQGSSPGSQCPIDRQYTWSVVGDQGVGDELTLTQVVVDTCLTNGYLDGIGFTRVSP